MTNPAVGMPCPVCKVPLVMSERQGVEIDYCPQCRGVWLDRGELDKIIERSAAQDAPAPQAPQAPPPPPQPQPVQQPHYRQPEFHQPNYGHDPYRQGHYKKRKKSFFEELFD